MNSPRLSPDVPARPWTGRDDGTAPEHRRWWQAVRPLDEAAPGGERSTRHETAPGTRRRAVLLGFASDEGVRRNKGRVGAAESPAALRAALGPLAWHLDRDVFDAGDIVVTNPSGGHHGEGADLEGGQERCGTAISTLLDDGALTVVLGGGHETAFASYLGVAGSRRVAEGARVGVLNLDAHFDLRDELIATSGTPFLQMARAEQAAGRELHYAVVGISRPNNTAALFRTADELGVRYLLDEDCERETAEAFVDAFLRDVDAVYLTIDLDVLPASVAPGVSAPAALGVRLDVIVALCRRLARSGKLLHLDVAELNPRYDVDSRTAKVAARLIDTLLG